MITDLDNAYGIPDLAHANWVDAWSETSGTVYANSNTGTVTIVMGGRRMTLPWDPLLNAMRACNGGRDFAIVLMDEGVARFPGRTIGSSGPKDKGGGDDLS